MTETVSGASRTAGTTKRQRGMRLERVFTRPGVHPYDEVTWERRDVVMTNWRDGSINFEQRGVEFPDSWSVNAANIVTTKYFRGAVNTEVRESSLRQLIDRVVKTYRKSGEDNGYFASPEDAEIFDHELTHMLLHQVFSFNSPVWFNVGTASPQQVSACQPYDALVSTPAGLVPIGKLVEDRAVGTKVYDAHGVTKVVAVKANGVKPVLRLGLPLLPDGSQRHLDVTGDHLVWRVDPALAEGGEFVPAAELAQGDWLLWVDPDKGGRNTEQICIDAVVDCGEMDVYDIQTESGEYLSSGLRVHNCFILAVDDTMDSILNWYREEGLIFKGGSGAGLNLSRIRSSKELLSSGGTASGPVSFMRGADASAGTIKSGGATRRAAKMVILDVDHPDIEEFVETKAREEDKIRALRDAGYDMDLGGKDIVSVQYQNANNSVRVNDEFMRAFEEGGEFGLRARATGEVIDTVDAKELFGKVAQAAWACADPGIQYDDTINDWHTTPETGRITASNPCCFTGDTLVPTSQGLMTFELLNKTVAAGHPVHVCSYDGEAGGFVEGIVEKSWVAGRTALLKRVVTDTGLRLECTPEHRFLVGAAEWVEARRLLPGTTLTGVDGDVVHVTAVEDVVLDRAVKVYDMEVAGHHNFVVAGEGISGVVAHNSEYMHLDNSSCNLASLNLLKFLTDDDTFDAVKFVKSVELIITAMDISICFADFPTQAIGDTTRAYRQLGIGYANLGALLMATGHAYDSTGGRSLAAAITSLMTGTAYKRSAELAAVVGPYDGYARNAAAHQRVMRKHAAANDEVRPVDADAARVLHVATKVWQECLAIGAKNGWRNAQASVLAPTGCLTADTLVTTDRGLVRLDGLGEIYGEQWQDLDVRVSTDDGPQQTTKFFINGEEPTRRIVTEGGYRIQGTLAHRIKVVDETTGEWTWKRLADVAAGDLAPVQLNTMVGEARRVPLPVLDQAYYAGDRSICVPDAVDADLGELVGYFMGAGSLHATGIRFGVANTDLDVRERLRVLGKSLFNLEPETSQQPEYVEVTLSSMRLARWWQAAGFAQSSCSPEATPLPREDHVGKGWTLCVPAALLETNDREVYAAFLRGLFEADGAVVAGVPAVSTASQSFATETRTLLLALGIATTTRETVSGSGATQVQVGLRNLEHAQRYADVVGFMGGRNSRLLDAAAPTQASNRDRIYLPRQVWDAVAPTGSPMRSNVVSSLAECGAVSRFTAELILADHPDSRLAAALGYLFERVASNDDGGVQPTYDLSVPSNVTYVANGLISHNTIGLMMDCDTTGIEPDLALVKFKKLVGGGSMQIVNQTIPRALTKLGYENERAEAIIEHIAEHGNVIDAPGLKSEHYDVFDCAMGERSITPMGHVRMMAATQPFISGAISKCVTGETLLTTADGLVRIGSLHQDESPDSFRDEIIEVASLNGPQKTDAFYFGGVRPVREVALRSGHRVVGTPNHRVLVAGEAGLDWRMLADLAVDDYVAMQYGADMWATVPARFDDVVLSAPYGNQKSVTLPTEMTDELAFLLGAYAAEGHTTRSTWSVIITNSVDSVLERVRDAWASEFGVTARIVRQPGKCPGVVVSSKAVVEFLEYLSCGERARTKRIPDAVLRSTRSMVLSFLSGLALDAYVTTGPMGKWAICLDAPALLDDLQAVLTNLGVVHGRISKHNAVYDKDYDEVYACGTEAQHLLSLVPFAEPAKASSARLLSAREFTQSTADVVPGVSGRDLHSLIPVGKSGRHGYGDRSQFSFLLDPRTQHVSRRTLERVAQLSGVRLPQWLQTVLDENLRFSPVCDIHDDGEREVFDVSVPTTHAFVGNGVVNHNTVNMPETATVEEVADVYYQGWKLGLKALAIYRDNCKVGQPLTDARAKKADVVEAGESRLVRRRLPRKRPSQTVSFSVAGAEGYMTAGSYPDDGLGEVFLKLGKQGSTLSGVMDAFSIAISIALQYGVPLETYVQKFTNMRFEPAGMTDDPDIRMAQSVMDYIFRRLALDYLPKETRAELGIHTAEERAASVAATSYGSAPAAPAVDDEDLEVDVETMRGSVPVEAAHAAPAPAEVRSSTELIEAQQGTAADAPLCLSCGVKMRPAGSCYVCESCGSTSGCS